MGTTRRDFLTTAAAAAAGAAAGGGHAHAQEQEHEHGHDHTTVPSDMTLRVKALESLQSYDLGGITLGYSPTNRIGSRFVEVTVIGPRAEPVINWRITALDVFLISSGVPTPIIFPL